VKVLTEAGFSPFSSRTTFILADVPTMSSAPIELSSKESEITVGWQLTSNGGSVITGYRLYQTNVTDGGETLIYEGRNIPTVTSTVIRNLVAGHQYMYRVSGINRVGEG